MTRSERNAKELVKAFPGISGIEDRDGEIHLGDCAKGGTIDHLPACDLSAKDDETIYVSHVHPKLMAKAEELGLCIECLDPETFSAYDI